jgi:hypothetical protein
MRFDRCAALLSQTNPYTADLSSPDDYSAPPQIIKVDSWDNDDKKWNHLLQAMQGCGYPHQAFTDYFKNLVKHTRYTTYTVQEIAHCGVAYVQLDAFPFTQAYTPVQRKMEVQAYTSTGNKLGTAYNGCWRFERFAWDAELFKAYYDHNMQRYGFPISIESSYITSNDHRTMEQIAHKVLQKMTSGRPLEYTITGRKLHPSSWSLRFSPTTFHHFEPRSREHNIYTFYYGSTSALPLATVQFRSGCSPDNQREWNPGTICAVKLRKLPWPASRQQQHEAASYTLNALWISEDHVRSGEVGLTSSIPNVALVQKAPAFLRAMSWLSKRNLCFPLAYSIGIFALRNRNDLFATLGYTSNNVLSTIAVTGGAFALYSTMLFFMLPYDMHPHIHQTPDIVSNIGIISGLTLLSQDHASMSLALALTNISAFIYGSKLGSSLSNFIFKKDIPKPTPPETEYYTHYFRYPADNQ